MGTLPIYEFPVKSEYTGYDRQELHAVILHMNNQEEVGERAGGTVKKLCVYLCVSCGCIW